MIFQILGSALIGLGLWFLLSYHNSEINISYVLHNTSFISISLIVIGCIVTIISFFGFWGAFKENTFMLKFYAWILLFILFFKMWGAIFIAISSYRERAHATNVSEFKTMFDHYGINNGDTLLVDAVQTTFQCCGYDRPHSIEFANASYPWSCCGIEKELCKEPIFTSGCEQRIPEVISPILFTITIVYYTVVGIQILCIITAFCLSSSITKKLAAKPLYYNL
ncbi:hypothetical protein Trydic_g17696 [Trypoxylus dichotomus]